MIVWLIVPWVFTALWIGVGVWGQNSAVLKRTTEEMMRANDSLIQSYARKYGEAPASLTELRLYAKLKGRAYAGVDSWGGRFEYLRLGRVNYTLRSFGDDGVQNTEESSPDPGIFRWGQMVKSGLQYDYEAGIRQARPSVLLFAGADDDRRKWHAKLFLDSATGSRRLLVRNKRILNLYMLAPHDGIEEFLWLPDQERLVFTASGSQRYGDGLWVWDLKSDHSWNLLELEKNASDLSPSKQARGVHIALSYATKPKSDVEPKTGQPIAEIGAFIVPSTLTKLEPAWFFHPQNLHIYELSNTEAFEHKLPTEDAKSSATQFDYEWMGQSTVASGGSGSGMQRAWLRLPRSGNWETAMSVWQEYAAANAQSPLAAYAVWSLALFYRDAEREANDHPKEREILHGFSTELYSGLSKMLSAPGWLRAVGASEVQD